MAELKIVSGPSKGKLFRIGNGIATIGREQTNSVQINDYEISRRHAELHVRENEWKLIDLGSSNGTLVNGDSVNEKHLTTGDQIKIGQSVVEFHELKFESDSTACDETVRNGTEESDFIEDTISSGFGAGNELLKTESNLEVLYHAALAAGSYQSTENLLQRILDLVFCWISAHRSCILIREDQQECLFAKSIDPNQPDEYLTQPFDIEYAVIKYVFRKKEGIVVNDIINDERFPYVIEGEELQNRQIICAPINSRHGIRGVIYADKSKLPLCEDDSVGPPFDEQQLKLLIAIGLHASVAIENADHYAMMLQSERVTAVGNAMASLSHHIKNILQSINGGTHLIEDGLANQNLQLINGGWKIVQKNQQNLANLVMDMLTYSKPLEPRLQNIDLIPLVPQVFSALEVTARNMNVELVFAPPDNHVQVLVEPDLMRRSINNVLLFCINSCRDNSGGKIVLSITHGDNKAEILIKDNGTALSSHELNSIFDPLSTSERSNRIGLGIAVAKKIMQEMGGTITVSSNEDEGGNQFRLSFPKISANAQTTDKSLT